LIKILGISGSLRAKSFNSALLAAAVKLQPEDAQIEVASIRDIPLYDGDVEARGVPAAVDALKARVVATDALLLVTPEYNNSLPGVFKNAIDWLSRPSADVKRVFGNRPVAIIGTSPGSYGTILSQQAWLPVLRTLGTRPWFGGRLQVAHAQQVFDDTGELIDEKVRAHLAEFLRGFSAFAAGR
jgi:NAD(P)H-dependent FMN reductase